MKTPFDSMNMLAKFHGNLPLDFDLSHAQVDFFFFGAGWWAGLKVSFHWNIHYVLTANTRSIFYGNLTATLQDDLSMPKFKGKVTVSLKLEETVFRGSVKSIHLARIWPVDVKIPSVTYDNISFTWILSPKIRWTLPLHASCDWKSNKHRVWIHSRVALDSFVRGMSPLTYPY